MARGARVSIVSIALLFMGCGTASSFFGDGRLCVGPGASGVFGFPVRSTGDGTLTSSGLVSDSHVLFGPSVHIQAGDVWHFQLWYRDPAGPCAAGSNLTQAVSLGFGP